MKITVVKKGTSSAKPSNKCPFGVDGAPITDKS